MNFFIFSRRPYTLCRIADLIPSNGPHQSFSRRHLIVESIHTYKEAKWSAAADFFIFATTAIQSARFFFFFSFPVDLLVRLLSTEGFIVCCAMRLQSFTWLSSFIRYFPPPLIWRLETLSSMAGL